uniref:Uncharacterized protein n=1 Tax=viral metagenome TaxID=1070528 RepID=A0A6H1ZPF9_9ZZZZ
MRPKVNRSARDIQDTDLTVITNSDGKQEFMYKMGDVAGYVLKSISASSAFINQTSVTVTHGRGYKPIVWIEDGSSEMLGSFGCTHTSVLAFTITFAVSQSGTIHYI